MNLSWVVIGLFLLIYAALVVLAVAGSGVSLVALQVAAGDQKNARKAATEDQKAAASPHHPARDALRYGGKSFERVSTSGSELRYLPQSVRP